MEVGDRLLVDMKLFDHLLRGVWAYGVLLVDRDISERGMNWEVPPIKGYEDEVGSALVCAPATDADAERQEPTS